MEKNTTPLKADRRKTEATTEAPISIGETNGHPANAAKAGLAMLDEQTAKKVESVTEREALKKAFDAAEKSKEAKIYRIVDAQWTERFVALGNVDSSVLKAKAIEFAKARGVYVQVQASAATYYVDKNASHITTWGEEIRSLGLPTRTFSASDIREIKPATAEKSTEASVANKPESGLEREIRKALENGSIEPEEARRILKELLGEAKKITDTARASWMGLDEKLRKDAQIAMGFKNDDVDGKIAKVGKTGKTVGEFQKIAAK